MSKIVTILIIVLVLSIAGAIALLGYFWGDELVEPIDLPYMTRDVAEETGIGNGETESDVASSIEIVARDLEIPWEIVFLPDGDFLVTQRTGSIKRISENGQTYSVDGVEHVGEGGLLGMTLHPNFEENKYIYLYMTTRVNDGLENRVVRYRLDNDKLTDQETILESIPGAIYHDGGRIAFSPDGYLFITTGDARQPDLAQDKESLAGKILRVNDDGSVPNDNPFGNEVYSYGHRNPQGLAWDSEGRLWAPEHGANAKDELNVIEKGNNYGWPLISGDESRDEMKTPVINSGRETWAPGGAIYWENSILFTGLRGASLYQAQLNGTEVTDLVAHFENQFGRLRTVVIGPDDKIYVATNNTDGRGSSGEGDDMILRINPDALKE